MLDPDGLCEDDAAARPACAVADPGVEARGPSESTGPRGAGGSNGARRHNTDRHASKRVMDRTRHLIIPGTGSLVLLLALALMAATPGPTAGQSSEPPGDQVAAPIVFYRTIGDGQDRLYRRVLDGSHQPELVAQRPAGFDDDPSGTWWVAPDGSVAVHMGVLEPASEESRTGGLEAIPLQDGASSWRLARGGLDPELVAWSPDGLWLSDGRSLIDVTTGTTRDLDVPDGWWFCGFAVEDDAPLYVSGDLDDRTLTLWRLDVGSGERQTVPWGSIAAVGTSWPASVSPVLGQALTTVRDQEDGESGVVVRDLRTWSDTVIAGLPERARPVGFDSTGRVPLALATSRDETGVPPRRDLALYAIDEGSARPLWRGPGQVSPEPMLTTDGRYLLTQPHYADAALLLVALDGSGTVSIPLPEDVAGADPVALIAGTAPPSDRLALPTPAPPAPGDRVAGAPSVVVTSVEAGEHEQVVGRVQVLGPSVGGTVVEAETTVPIPSDTRADLAEVTAVPRPGHRDVLILAGWWTHPRVYRWTPGDQPRPIRSLAGARAIYRPMWSPDGRHLALRVGSSGRRFAVVDGALRVERRITLPRDWTNAELIGWTADSERLVLDPPTVGYAATSPTFARAVCENRMPMATVSIATGRLAPHEAPRALRVRFGPGDDARAATGEWTTVDRYRRGFAFEHGCPVTMTRSEVALSGLRLRDLAWSHTGTTLFVLAGELDGDGPPDRIILYRRPWSDPDQRPRTVRLDGSAFWLGEAAPGGRWLVVEGEGRFDGRSVGLLDLGTGAIHWIAEAVSFEGWTTRS